MFRLNRSGLLLVVLLAGCTQVVPPTIEPTVPPTIEPSATLPPLDAWRNRPIAGLPFNDPRLASVFAELRQHPEWLDGPLAVDPTVLALVPVTSHVCLALEGPAAEAIDVSGNANPSLARAIAEAIYARPERFGIDRWGIPSVLVHDPIEPAPPGWTCLQAVVFDGGPRSHVVIGTRPTGDGRSQLQTRIVERALLPPEPRREGHC